MELILLETVKNLGNLGDRVNVKSGYGRNYLIPQNMAVFATEENIIHFEKQRAQFEKKEAQAFAKAQQRAAKLQDVTVVIAALASDEGRLYGSVGVTEIKEALQAKSIAVERREIVMPEGPIHMLGDFVVDLHLHSNVIARLQIQVVASK